MNSINPLTVLDAILGDWATPKIRRLVHGLVALAIALVTIWLAADGDWAAAGAALVTAIYAAANKANTPATDLAEADEPDVDEDDLSYTEAGGTPFPEGDDESALHGDGADRGYDGRQDPLSGL